MNLLESLKKISIIVADTGDIDSIARVKPQDATTNPSLLLQAAQNPAYRPLVDDALAFGMKARGDRAAKAGALMEKLSVNFGREILKHVKGRVSTEVDAGLSFDIEGTLAKARRLIELYQQVGMPRQGGDAIGMERASSRDGFDGARDVAGA